jgi:hypothetical protein
VNGIGLERLVRAGMVLWLSSAALLAGGAAPSPEDRSGERGHPADVFTPLLEKRLKGGASRDDVVVDVRWPHDGLLASCRVYGNGVGIWNREVQVRLGASEVVSLLKAAVKIRFGSFPTTIGGDEEAGEETQKGRITISVGTVRKTVVQVEPGEQSPELQGLAERFLKAAQAGAGKGARASSFADAFEKLASGKLAAETLEVTLQRKTRDPSGVPREAWLLQIDGRQVQDRVIEPGRERRPVRVLFLSKTDFAKLLGLLRESHAASLPQNLYADHYTDLLVEVLKQHKHIQARRFAGMTAQSPSEKQQWFDRLLEGLVALHGRAQKEGRLVEAIDLTGSGEEEQEREKREKKGGGEKPGVTPAAPPAG